MGEINAKKTYEIRRKYIKNDRKYAACKTK